MHITIIGAGAAGMLFAGKLSSAGYKVTLTDINQERISAVSRSGIKILSPLNDVIIHSFPETSAYENLRADKIAKTDFFIFCVKAYSTSAAAESVRKFAANNSIAVTFQNGAGNIEKIAAFFNKRSIAAGITTEGASFLSPGSIIHGGSGETIIGMIDNSERQRNRLMPLIEAFENSGFKAGYTDFPAGVIWKKLAVNACINPLTALTGSKNRYTAESIYLREIIKLAASEICTAAASDKITLDPADIYRTVIGVAEKTGENTSSMLQDIIAGRKTEIKEISGFIARKSTSDARVNNTLFLLVKALEQIKMNSGHL